MLEPKKYKKKPLPVEVVQFNAELGREFVLELADWCGGQFAYVETLPGLADNTYYWSIVIPTEEGPMHSRAGDYILKGPFGEFWSVKRHIFEETYEEYIEE